MQGRNPGIWIGAAVALAVIVVAVSIPRSPQRPPDSTPAAPAKVDSPAPVAATGGGESVASKAPSRPAGVPVPDSTPAVTVAKVAGNLPPPAPGAPVPPEGQPPISRETALQAVDNVQFALRDFRAALGSNPVGNNAEITKAILGDNAKQAKMEMPAGSQVSPTGELCDPWGTPYFFHQMSAQKMEIRSAGPDRVMWTKDDIQM